MGQRLIISENERSQIAKMHGLIKEQPGDTQPGQPPKAPQPPKATAVNTVTNPKDLVGKTVNLYKDVENRQIEPTLTQMSITRVNEPGFEIQVGRSDVRFNLKFDCASKSFSTNNNQNKYYNKPLADLLTKTWCSKNNAGSDVPRADFASTNTGDSSVA